MFKFKQFFFNVGGRAGSVLLEQRVHYVTDGGEQSHYNANNVSGIISHLKGALESNHCLIGV